MRPYELVKVVWYGIQTRRRRYSTCRHAMLWKAIRDRGLVECLLRYSPGMYGAVRQERGACALAADPVSTERMCYAPSREPLPCG